MGLVEQVRERERTYPVTFRLPENLVAEMRKEAEQLQVSVNTLVNQVLHRYTTWDRPSSKLGLIPMTRGFLKEVIHSLPNKEIKQIACNGSKEALEELVLITKGNFTLDSFVAVFNEWLRVSWMSHRYEYDGTAHHCVIHHDLGDKWSLYLSELVIAICKDLFVRPIIRTHKRGISFSLNS